MLKLGYYSIEFRLHRATVTIPVVITMFAIILRSFAWAKYTRPLWAMVVVVGYIGLLFQKEYLASRIPHEHLPLINIVLDNQPLLVQSRTSLYFLPSPSPTDPYISFADTMKYFLPTIVLQREDKLVTSPCSPQFLPDGIFVIAPTHACASVLTRQIARDEHYQSYGFVPDPKEKITWWVVEKR